MKRRSGLARSLLSVSSVLILVKALGFVKQMVIAAAFGANVETDLINISYGFIGDIQYLLVICFYKCCLPQLFRYTLA